ncbi:unnamed protein product, partial [Gulo gulo]
AVGGTAPQPGSPEKNSRLLFRTVLPSHLPPGQGRVSINGGQRLYLNTEWEESQRTRPPAMKMRTRPHASK